MPELFDYELSSEAEQDLDSIYDYSFDEFGQNRAIEYLTELEKLFFKLVENPFIGRTRNEIKKGLFSFSYQSQVVFYRIIDSKIRIVRVLHGSKDIPNQFS